MPFVVHNASKTGNTYKAEVSYARLFDKKVYGLGSISFTDITTFKTAIDAALKAEPEAYLSFRLDQYDNGR